MGRDLVGVPTVLGDNGEPSLLALSVEGLRSGLKLQGKGACANLCSITA